MQEKYVDIFKNMQKHVYLVGIVDGKTKELKFPLDAAKGTAFAVSTEGHFLTAFHLIENDYENISKGDRILALKGSHGHGTPHEPAFEVEVLEAFPKYDIALLKGSQRRQEYIPTAARYSLPGAWIASIGYPLSYYDSTRGKVMVTKRIVSAMISQGLDENGVKKVEIDKHLSHGHSGGPIMTLKGIAFGVAIAHVKGWFPVKEKLKENDKIKEKNRVFQLPVQFSKGTLIYNVATRLRKHGVPVL